MIRTTLACFMLTICLLATTIAPCANAASVHIVSPSANENVEGNLNLTETGGSGNVQYLFLASDFASLPESNRLLVGWNLRADASQTEPVDWTFHGEKIWVSTTTKTKLTGNFAADHGPDKTLVFDGSFVFPVVVTGPPAGPNPLRPVVGQPID